MSSRAPSPVRGRRRLPIWARIVLAAAVAAAVGLAGALLWFAAMLSGGLDDLLPRDRPDEDDPAVVTARDGAADADRALAGRLAALGGVPVTTAQHDECREGQHNFKIDDDYDLSCVLSTVALVPLRAGDGAPGETSYQPVADRLVAEGWSRQDTLAGTWFVRDGSRLSLRVVASGEPLHLYPDDLAPVERAHDELPADAPGSLLLRLDDEYFRS